MVETINVELQKQYWLEMQILTFYSNLTCRKQSLDRFFPVTSDCVLQQTVLKCLSLSCLFRFRFNTLYSANVYTHELIALIAIIGQIIQLYKKTYLLAVSMFQIQHPFPLHSWIGTRSTFKWQSSLTAYFSNSLEINTTISSHTHLIDHRQTLFKIRQICENCWLLMQ